MFLDCDLLNATSKSMSTPHPFLPPTTPPIPHTKITQVLRTPSFLFGILLITGTCDILLHVYEYGRGYVSQWEEGESAAGVQETGAMVSGGDAPAEHSSRVR